MDDGRGKRTAHSIRTSSSVQGEAMTKDPLMRARISKGNAKTTFSFAKDHDGHLFASSTRPVFSSSSSTGTRRIFPTIRHPRTFRFQRELGADPLW